MLNIINFGLTILYGARIEGSIDWWVCRVRTVLEQAQLDLDPRALHLLGVLVLTCCYYTCMWIETTFQKPEISENTSSISHIYQQFLYMKET